MLSVVVCRNRARAISAGSWPGSKRDALVSYEPARVLADAGVDGVDGMSCQPRYQVVIADAWSSVRNPRILHEFLKGLGVLPARWWGSCTIPYAIGAWIELDSSGRRCFGFRRLVARLSPRRGAAFHRRQGRRDDVEQGQRVQGGQPAGARSWARVLGAPDCKDSSRSRRLESRRHAGGGSATLHVSHSSPPARPAISGLRCS